MGLIYSQATLTVIAAAGIDPSYGLPGVTSTPRKHRTSFQIGSKKFVVSHSVWDELAESKWNNRGWTYQEAMLSRRRLVFTDNQFYFQCRAMHFPESISFTLRSLHISNGQRFPEKLDIWKAFPNRGVGNDLLSPRDRIEEFARRELTFDSDALNAFQGIIEEFKGLNRPVHFLSGIPLIPSEYFVRSEIGKAREAAQLTFGLTWGYRRRNQRKIHRRYAFPSWSWLDWKVETANRPAQVDFFRLSSTKSPRAKIILGFFQNHVEIGVELPDSTVIPWQCNRTLIESKFEEGESPKYLHIKGWTFDLEIARNTPEEYWKGCWPGTQRYKAKKSSFDNYCDVDMSSVTVDQLSVTLKVVLLCSTVNAPRIDPFRVGLFIKYSDRIKAYERIGICDLSDISLHVRGYYWFKGDEVEEKSSTHATLGPFHLVKSEIRLG